MLRVVVCILIALNIRIIKESSPYITDININPKTMKKVIVALILAAFFQTAFCQQQLYELWREAAKNMDGKQITYVCSDRRDYLEVREWKVDQQEFNAHDEEDYKFIGEELERKGYEYDPKNDTLVFCFLQSHSYPNIISVSAFSKSKRMRYFASHPEITAMADRYYYDEERMADSIVYQGNLDALMNLVAKRGIVLGGGLCSAYRIVIKDGEIQYPTSMWAYSAFM